MQLDYRKEGNTEYWSSDRGKLEISEPEQGIILLVFRGYATEEFIEPIVQRQSAILDKGKATVFNDWEHAEGYSTAVRKELTTWTSYNMRRIRRMHILVKSSLLKMGIGIAITLLKGNVKVYSNRQEFESILKQLKNKAAMASTK